MLAEFMFTTLAVCLLLGACSEAGSAYGMTFDALLEQRIEAGLVVILVMERKSILELKYGVLRGHLAFEYQLILIRTRAANFGLNLLNFRLREPGSAPKFAPRTPSWSPVPPQ